MEDDTKNIILGGLALFFGVMVFGWGGGQEIWEQGKLFNGIVNIVIGFLLARWGFKKMNGGVVITVKRKHKK